MKRFLVFGLFLFGVFVVFGCQKETVKGKSAPASTRTPVPASAKKVVMQIDGMTCGGCVSHITNALTKTKGVYRCKVTLKPPRAVIYYNAKLVDTKTLIAKIKGRAGAYTAMILRNPKATSKQPRSVPHPSAKKKK